jgi:hypothetical protein
LIYKFTYYQNSEAIRVIGGLCNLLSINIKYGYITIEIPNSFYILIYIFTFLQLFQLIIISIIKLKYGLNKILKHRKDFDVKISPLDKIASLTARMAYCI